MHGDGAGAGAGVDVGVGAEEFGVGLFNCEAAGRHGEGGVGLRRSKWFDREGIGWVAGGLCCGESVVTCRSCFK